MSTSTTAFVQLVVGMCGRPLLAKALPVFAAVAIAGGIVLGPTGLQPKDVARWAEDGAGFRLVLAALWALAIGPALRGALLAPGTSYVRSLRPPVHVVLMALAPLALVLHLPWIALFWAGDRLLFGLGSAGAITLALVSVVIARARAVGWVEQALGLLLAGAALALGNPWLHAATGAALGPALWRSWQAAAEAGHRKHAPRVLGSAVVALSLAHALRVVRDERAQLLRLLAVCALGLLFVGLVARNNRFASSMELCSVVILAALPVAATLASSLALMIERSESALHGWTRSSGLSSAVEIAARLVPVVAGSLILHGALWGLALTRAKVGWALWPTAALLAHAVLFAVIAAAVSRWAASGARGDGARVAAIVLLVALAAVLLWAALSWAALVVEAALTAVLVLAPADGVEDRGARSR